MKAQTEKLSALGRMAAGIAHEINNPLGGILLFSTNMRKNVTEDGPFKEGLEVIIRESQRCKDIIQGLLEFSRDRTPQKAMANINNTIDKVINILDNEFRLNRIQIMKHLYDQMPDTMLDVNKMHQVFTNILLNAVEAIKENGVITIRSYLSPDRKIGIIEIEDTGCGIQSDDMPKIFEPFFSTKSNGTGLGLARSYGIIQNHEGNIEVSSKTGQGTRFTIKLPISKEVYKMKAKREKKRIIGFQVVEDECIWMKAGIVNFRLCDNAYDCQNCPFDMGMGRTLRSGNLVGTKKKEPEWVEQLKACYQGSERPCRHALTGRIDAPKICPLDYECYHCAFDQMLDEQDLAELNAPPSYDLASGYRIANGYYYHMGHNWARFEHGGRVKVGFDDFLVKLFGPINFLTLPPLGTTLKKDQVGLTFGRDNHRAATLSPVTGTVLAVNHKACEHPEITHEDPYYEGWLYILEPNMPKRNLKGLYYGRESIQWMDQESQNLLKLLGPEYEQLVPTGGQPISDVYGNFPELGWDVLAKTFLKTEKI